MRRNTILAAVLVLGAFVGPAMVTAHDDHSESSSDHEAAVEVSIEPIGLETKTRRAGHFSTPADDLARTPEARAIEGPMSRFIPISSYRSYDSRNDPVGRFLSGEDSQIDVLTDEFSTAQIPIDATAVTFNVTVADTDQRGYVQIYGPGTDPFSTSTVNWWTSGAAIANSGSTMLGEFDGVPGHMGVALGGLGSAHVIIDITGYYVP